jgi:hypothetical protein
MYGKRKENEMSDLQETKKPIRVQRKRMKGWRMPENALYVGRSTRWGNPFRIGMFGATAKQAVEAYRSQLISMKCDDPEYFRLWIKPLVGKDLACF